MSARNHGNRLTKGASQVNVPHFCKEANLNRYVLGLREENGQIDQAVAYRTASKTVAEIEAWQAEGGLVTVILRNGKAIPKAMLLSDANKEKQPPGGRKRAKRLPRNEMGAAIADSRR